MVSIFFFFLGFSLFFSFFNKKLVPLLCLEIFMVLIILLYLESFSFFSSCMLISQALIFLVFMVLDSVLGISLLLCSCRSSSKISFSCF